MEPLWERWTIDEVADGMVRVLVAEARDAAGIQPLMALTAAEPPTAAPSGVRRAALRDAAMRIELRPPREAWGREVDGYVPAAALYAFLRARNRKHGLPRTRPIREGDTFWVSMADRAGLDLGASGGGTPFARRVEALGRAGAEVWDVTGAARASVKQAYQAIVGDEADGRPQHRRRGTHRG
jgi:hypothetical protein